MDDAPIRPVEAVTAAQIADKVTSERERYKGKQRSYSFSLIEDEEGSASHAQLVAQIIKNISAAISSQKPQEGDFYSPSPTKKNSPDINFKYEYSSKLMSKFASYERGSLRDHLLELSSSFEGSELSWIEFLRSSLIIKMVACSFFGGYSQKEKAAEMKRRKRRETEELRPPHGFEGMEEEEEEQQNDRQGGEEESFEFAESTQSSAVDTSTSHFQRRQAADEELDLSASLDHKAEGASHAKTIIEEPSYEEIAAEEGGEQAPLNEEELEEAAEDLSEEEKAFMAFTPEALKSGQEDFLKRFASGELTEEEKALLDALQQELPSGDYSMKPQNPDVLRTKSVQRVKSKDKSP